MNGYGFFAGQDWQAGYFGSELSPAGLERLSLDHRHWINVLLDPDLPVNINLLELIPVWLCLLRCVHLWSGKHVVCYTDKPSVTSMLNKGVSSNSTCMHMLRAIFWLCAVNNVYLTARHIYSEQNVCADMLSRVSQFNSLVGLRSFNLCCRHFL